MVRAALADRFHFYCGCLLMGGLHALYMPTESWPLTGLLGSLLVLVCVLPGRILRQLLLGLAILIAFWLRLANHLQVTRDSPPLMSSDQTLLGQVTQIRDGTAELDVLRVCQSSGDCRPVWMTVRVQLPVAALQPGTLIQVPIDRSRMILFQGRWHTLITAVHFARDRTEFRGLSRIRILSNHTRIWLVERLRDALPFSHALSAFLQMSLFQDKAEANHPLVLSLKGLGLSHVLVTSGFHVTLLAMLIAFTLNRLISSARQRLLVFWLFLAGYGLICGYSVSLLRALLFSCLLTSVGHAERPVHTVRILLIIMFLHAFVFPFEVLSPAFYLSYGITWLLLILPSLPPQVPEWANTLLKGLVIQALLIPYLAGFLGGYSLSMLASVFLAWLFPPLLISGFLLLLLSVIAPTLARGLGTLVGPYLEWPLNLLQDLNLPQEFLTRFEFHGYLPALLAFYGLVFVIVCFWPDQIIGRGQIKRFAEVVLGYRILRPRIVYRELCGLIGNPIPGIPIEEGLRKYSVMADGVHGRRLAPWLILGPLQRRFCLICDRYILNPLRQQLQSYPIAIARGHMEHPVVRSFFLDREQVEYDAHQIRQIILFLMSCRQQSEWGLFFTFAQQRGFPVQELFACLPDLLSMERRYFHWLDQESVPIQVFLAQKLVIRDYLQEEGRVFARMKGGSVE